MSTFRWLWLSIDGGQECRLLHDGRHLPSAGRRLRAPSGSTILLFFLRCFFRAIDFEEVFRVFADGADLLAIGMEEPEPVVGAAAEEVAVLA